MDTKAYIESGVIESYVLGLASADEAAELELLCMQHADIKNAVDEFAALIEANAFNNAVTPPPTVKDKVMLALSEEFEKEKNKIVPVIPLHTGNTDAETVTVAPKPTWRYLAAASIILLVVSTALNFYFYSNYKTSNEKYVALLEERNSLQAKNDVNLTRLNDYEESMHIIQNPDVQKIDLPGIKGHENTFAAVYWDSKTKDVYLLPAKMDALPSDKQYQLWAIVDGKPVSAGLVEDCNGLCKMSNVPKASMFAITVEPKGGSQSPHLDAMVVAGAVKI
ncbi:anti-sigma factor [Panacibacter ginsenosidivorans]|uniref:Anti-sigma factor n=1 Tax=Panacibacter ginsenosidivorans TaxID=1813871 RepID=A0A5B8VBU9_9BACT|nr:anti-sigma factor [Panacibacter ginsenosidivorans]QEC67748.1 anti-sigma factor [Panacibacter ginsenosidivorans]